jgi:hypothetical protein
VPTAATPRSVTAVTASVGLSPIIARPHIEAERRPAADPSRLHALDRPAASSTANSVPSTSTFRCQRVCLLGECVHAGMVCGAAADQLPAGPASLPRAGRRRHPPEQKQAARRLYVSCGRSVLREPQRGGAERTGERCRSRRRQARCSSITVGASNSHSCRLGPARSRLLPTECSVASARLAGSSVNDVVRTVLALSSLTSTRVGHLAPSAGCRGRLGPQLSMWAASPRRTHCDSTRNRIAADHGRRGSVRVMVRIANTIQTSSLCPAAT